MVENLDTGAVTEAADAVLEVLKELEAEKASEVEVRVQPAEAVDGTPVDLG